MTAIDGADSAGIRGRPRMSPVRAALFAVVASLSGAGCGSSGASGPDCNGQRLRPNDDRAILGEFYPRGNEPARPGSRDRVPFEWVLQLESTCGSPVTIERTCLIGDPEAGGRDTEQFFVEGPRPETVPPDRAAAIRVTYRRQSLNPRDENGDGRPDADRVGLVVQSNADNRPTIVVPICARVISANRDKQRIESCEPPIEVESGEKTRGLCGTGG
ncbi:MAG: hypothetical protein ABEL76_13310 [Bradymonadaceae bacterium]